MLNRRDDIGIWRSILVAKLQELGTTTAANGTGLFTLVLEHAPRLLADLGSIKVYDGPFIYFVQWPVTVKERLNGR